MGVFAGERLGAVSYTHLDVYKRQVETGWEQYRAEFEAAGGPALEEACLLYTSRCV